MFILMIISDHEFSYLKGNLSESKMGFTKSECLLMLAMKNPSRSELTLHCCGTLVFRNWICQDRVDYSM